MAEIRLEKITYWHGKDTPYQIKALDDLSLTIPHGMLTGLIGHTGSGKSTLVQMLNGILKPDSGKVLLDGADIWENPKKIRDLRFRVGLVMQYPEYQLFEETVYKDIAFGPKNMGLDENEIRNCVEEAIHFAGLGRELLEKSPFDLSGGQKRKVAIAGVMAMRPEILVLDEPAAGLDPQGRKSVFSNILEYQRNCKTTVVVVSHSMEDMAEYCDYIAVMSGGKIALQGDTETVFRESQTLSSIGLDVPRITSLMLLLRERGIDVNAGVYTVADAYRELKKLYK